MSRRLLLAVTLVAAAFLGTSRPAAAACKVTCGAGTYACCYVMKGVDKCVCRPDNSDDDDCHHGRHGAASCEDPSATRCTIACGAGYYACCRSGELPSCTCVANGVQVIIPPCDGGGEGSPSCGYGERPQALDQFLATLAANPDTLDAPQQGALLKFLKTLDEAP